MGDDTASLPRMCFNPRLPGGRRPQCTARVACADAGFQSTPSGGKATAPGRRALPCVARFNPRLPGGRRRGTTQIKHGFLLFQSTPSGGKATNAGLSGLRDGSAFQSTPSGGKATLRSLTRCATRRFQSTPSGGKATYLIYFNLLYVTFQSTPSGGKATRCTTVFRFIYGVSIHAFRGEGDRVF